jgi:predicted nucleotidyltransferase
MEKSASIGSPRFGLEAIRDSDRRRFLKELLTILEGFFGEDLVSVVVFGSVARGDAKPSSDTDVLVVARNMPRSMSDRMGTMVRVLMNLEKTEVYRELREKGVCTWIQFHPLSVEEAGLNRPIYLDMVEDAVILLDKNGFMKTVFDRLRKRLEELKARRVYLEDGSWFWDLKPDIKRGEVVEI